MKVLVALCTLVLLSCNNGQDAGQADGQGPQPDGDPGAPPIDLGPPLMPGDPGPADVRFEVRSDQAVHPISPLIYGTNGTRDIGQNRQTLARSGGNRMTAYNWETNASNAGSDYCFQNDSFLGGGETPGEAVRPLVAAAQQAGATALLTVPLVDYVAADKKGGSGPPGCSADVRKSGAGYLDTRFKKNRAQKGAPLSATPDPNDAFVNQDEFVFWVKSTLPSARVLYALDNEPDLWSFTHNEVHKDLTGYDELCRRNLDFARAIKAVAPGAGVTGLVSYGWSGYVTLQNAPDRAGKGEFIDYYLGKMKEGEAAAGKRLIDYLDLHWYPEARGGGVRITDKDTSAAVVEARVQAPRSLWDDTYRETSWIADQVGPIRLIPRMRDKIARGYPGTLLAITEWNYGGGGHISAALAGADVLGIFGREGVGLASIWELNADERYTYGALLAYRNFDGQGGHFGDTSILATTSDRAASSVYASLDQKDPARVVIIAINKRGTPLRAGITIAHPASLGQAAVYTLTAAGPKPAAAPGIKAVAQNAFSYLMPAQSVSILLPAP